MRVFLYEGFLMVLYNSEHRLYFSLGEDHVQVTENMVVGGEAESIGRDRLTMHAREYFDSITP